MGGEEGWEREGGSCHQQACTVECCHSCLFDFVDLSQLLMSWLSMSGLSMSKLRAVGIMRSYFAAFAARTEQNTDLIVCCGVACIASRRVKKVYDTVQ